MIYLINDDTSNRWILRFIKPVRLNRENNNEYVRFIKNYPFSQYHFDISLENYTNEGEKSILIKEWEIFNRTQI